MATYEELLKEGENLLLHENIGEARLDAWLLMEHLFQIDKVFYFVNLKSIVDRKLCNKYIELIQKRAAHVPLQYIIGKQEFMGLEFMVNKNVLIPRQDTEILVEEVLRFTKGKKILDLCTGSGCVAISLAKLGQVESAVGTDISTEALYTARENAILNKAEVKLIESDLFENVEGKFDIIVSNPPYIETDVIETLMPEVRLFEPHLALDGNVDGLYYYRRIIKEASEYLVKNGSLFLEIGSNQACTVKLLLQKAGYENINIKKDLSGFDRVVSASLIDV